MQLYLTRVVLVRQHVSGLFVTAVVCTVLLTARVGESSESTAAGGTVRDASVTEGAHAVADSNGPTIMLSYSRETFKKNPISSFMYFVPLISPTLVDRETSANNDQQVGIISYERKIRAKSFYVTCEFEILGKGFHINTFDPAGIIAAHTDEMKKNEPLTNMLDYIKFEGEGFGRIEVQGTIADSKETVTEVDLQFNGRGRKSPVTIGLYDIKPKNGQYKYENRSNESVARVNTLAFKKSEKNPRMGVSVASITKAAGSEGFFAGIKGAIANFFIKPPKIAELGNETMLNFGYSIFGQETAFTFPKARNIAEERIITTSNVAP